MAQTQIYPCKCKDEFQDKTYGAGNRLWNYGPKIMTNGGWRCTVCLATRGATTKVEEPKK